MLCFWEHIDAAVSPLQSLSPPLELRHPSTARILRSALIAVRSFSPRLPVHLLLIYLGHACCENRSIFCSSQQPRISESGCDCREIRPLKTMPCLIFRAANERSIALPQTSSQPAIIPSRGSFAWDVEGRGRYSADVCACVRALRHPGAGKSLITQSAASGVFFFLHLASLITSLFQCSAHVLDEDIIQIDDSRGPREICRR